jgi:hypothetical protein
VLDRPEDLEIQCLSELLDALSVRRLSRLDDDVPIEERLRAGQQGLADGQVATLVHRWRGPEK